MTGETYNLTFEGLWKFEDGEDPYLFEFYLRRSGKFYFRNSYGRKISIEPDDIGLKECMRLKLGQKYTFRPEIKEQEPPFPAEIYLNDTIK